jgi:DNA-binding beta-propeller fold protein YncE
MHGIAYDPVHDEIIIPVALSGAVLVFRGGAAGEEAPVRVIQGARTQLVRPHTIAVDPKHGEIIVGDPSNRSITIFDRLANGDVAPLRMIRGPQTSIHTVVGVAADPTRGLILAASRSAVIDSGIFVFDRSSNGNVSPLRRIVGPRTGALGRFRQLAVDADRGRIFLAVQAYRAESPQPEKSADLYNDPKALEALRAMAAEDEERETGGGDDGGSRRGSPLTTIGFIGAWDITDSGDVAPRAIIRGPATKSSGFGGVALNPVDGEIYGVGAGFNGYLAYFVPQFFQRPAVPTSGQPQ